MAGTTTVTAALSHGYRATCRVPDLSAVDGRVATVHVDATTDGVCQVTLEVQNNCDGVWLMSKDTQGNNSLWAAGPDADETLPPCAHPPLRLEVHVDQESPATGSAGAATAPAAAATAGAVIVLPRLPLHMEHVAAGRWAKRTWYGTSGPQAHMAFAGLLPGCEDPLLSRATTGVHAVVTSLRHTQAESAAAHGHGGDSSAASADSDPLVRDRYRGAVPPERADGTHRGRRDASARLTAAAEQIDAEILIDASSNTIWLSPGGVIEPHGKLTMTVDVLAGVGPMAGFEHYLGLERVRTLANAAPRSGLEWLQRAFVVRAFELWRYEHAHLAPGFTGGTIEPAALPARPDRGGGEAVAPSPSPEVAAVFGPSSLRIADIIKDEATNFVKPDVVHVFDWNRRRASSGAQSSQWAYPPWNASAMRADEPAYTLDALRRELATLRDARGLSCHVSLYFQGWASNDVRAVAAVRASNRKRGEASSTCLGDPGFRAWFQDAIVSTTRDIAGAAAGGTTETDASAVGADGGGGAASSTAGAAASPAASPVAPPPLPGAHMDMAYIDNMGTAYPCHAPHAEGATRAHGHAYTTDTAQADRAFAATLRDQLPATAVWAERFTGDFMVGALDAALDPAMRSISSEGSLVPLHLARFALPRVKFVSIFNEYRGFTNDDVPTAEQAAAHGAALVPWLLASVWNGLGVYVPTTPNSNYKGMELNSRGSIVSCYAFTAELFSACGRRAMRRAAHILQTYAAEFGSDDVESMLWCEPAGCGVFANRFTSVGMRRTVLTLFNSSADESSPSVWIALPAAAAHCTRASEEWRGFSLSIGPRTCGAGATAAAAGAATTTADSTRGVHLPAGAMGPRGIAVIVLEAHDLDESPVCTAAHAASPMQGDCGTARCGGLKLCSATCPGCPSASLPACADRSRADPHDTHTASCPTLHCRTRKYCVPWCTECPFLCAESTTPGEV